MAVFDSNMIDGVVEYSIKGRLTIGSNYRLNPSRGYPDVDPGVVIVEDLMTLNMSGIHDDIYDLIQIHIEDYLRDFDDPDEYQEHLDWLLNTVWVVYSYDRTSDYGVFPIKQFIDHTSRI